MTETCPYCRETISGDDKIHCPSCGTPHHRDCFAENGGCTVFGCDSAPPDAPKISVTSLDVPTTAPPPPLPSEVQVDRTLYFVNSNGEQYGPYSLRELQQFVGEKRIHLTDFAWTEGMTEWKFVSDVVGNLPSPLTVSTVAPTLSTAGLHAQSVHATAVDPLADRMKFGRGLFFLSVIGLVFVAGVFSTSKDTEGVGKLIFIIGAVTAAVLRVRDVGMSGWFVLLALVPIANLFLYFRLFCAPRGYELTRKADFTMKLLCWLVAASVGLSILAVIISSGNHH